METRVIAKRLYARSRRRLTLQALRDVKAGRVHDHAVIEAWARTLGLSKRSSSR